MPQANRSRYTKSKPEFDLRPYASVVLPGTVLFLPPGRVEDSLLSLTGPDRRALGHPCVVVSPPRDTDYMTSFGGNSAVEHIGSEYLQDFIAIEPTECVPGSPGVQLHLIGAPNNKGGYVDIVNGYWVPWNMLAKWVPGPDINSAHFDDTSIEIILRMIAFARVWNPYVRLDDSRRYEAQRTPYVSRLANKQSRRKLRKHNNILRTNQTAEVPDTIKTTRVVEELDMRLVLGAST